MKNGEYELVIAPSEYPGKRYRDKYCYEHHLIWWQNTGEVLSQGEVIHHKDHNKRHNDFSNLEKTTVESHVASHRKDDLPLMVEIVCNQCGISFLMRESVRKSRAKSYGHEHFCCSRSCQVRKRHADQKTA
jgi:intracellular sulfur oxidation DsrE/DsrF family protein